MTPLAIALLATALADDPSPAPLGPQVDVGPLVLTPQTVDATLLRIEPGALQLQTCLTAPPAAPPSASPPVVPDGQVMLQVRIRRGQVKVVTTTSISSGLEWLSPCLERRLAEWSWPVDKGRVEVPVTIHHGADPAPAEP